MTRSDPTFDLMVRALASSNVDLADEVACMVHLIRARFTAREMQMHLDAAREIARARRRVPQVWQYADFLCDLAGRACHARS